VSEAKTLEEVEEKTAEALFEVGRGHTQGHTQGLYSRPILKA
jgi:hypothetical protein